MKKKEQLVIPFRLDDMETLQWAVFPENYDSNENNIQIGFDFTFGINFDVKAIQCIPKITLLQSDKSFLTLEVAFLFSIEEKAWVKMISDNKLSIPKGLKEHFLVISVGTLRGVLFEKTHSGKTGIEKIILPTIDVRNDTGGDIVFDLSEE